MKHTRYAKFQRLVRAFENILKRLYRVPIGQGSQGKSWTVREMKNSQEKSGN